MVDRTSDHVGTAPEIEAEIAAESLGAALCDVAGRFAGNMHDVASALADEQKDRVVSLGYGLAEALRRAAAALGEEGSVSVSRRTGQVADRLRILADTVRRQSWRDIAEGVEGAARRRPLLFCAGALAAGFVAGRLVAGDAQRGDEEA